METTKLNEPLVILLTGPPKTGKTVSSATFPKPLLHFDFDNGGGRSIENLDIVQEKDEIKTIDFRKTKTYPLDFNSSRRGKGSPPHTGESNLLMTKFNGEIKGIKKGDYRTVVIDSLTSMFRLWKETILFMNQQSSIQIQDYMTLESVLFNQFIPSIKALPVDYVILIAHTTIDKDEISGRVQEFPSGPSVNMGRTMPQQFDEVWSMENNRDKYQWRTKKTGLFVGAGSRLNLPDPLTATYDELKKIRPSLP